MRKMNDISRMTDAEKKILANIKEHPTLVAQMSAPSEEFMRAAVCINPFVIRFIHNQSFAVRMRAVRQNGLALEYVNGRTPEIELAAVRQNGMAIKFIKHPSRDVQIAALKQNMQSYAFIKNPHVDASAMFFEHNKNIVYTPGLGLGR